MSRPPVLLPIVPDRVRKRAATAPECLGASGDHARPLAGSVAAELARLRLELWRLRRRLAERGGADDG
jgi:hypothetical protein